MATPKAPQTRNLQFWRVLDQPFLVKLGIVCCWVYHITFQFGKHVFFVGCFTSCPHCLSLLNDGHVAKADTLATGWARKSRQTWSSGVVQDGDFKWFYHSHLSIWLVYYCFTNIWVGFIGKSISIGRQRGLFQCQNERFETVGYIHLEIKDIKGTPPIHIQKVRRTVHSWQKFPQNTPREGNNNRLFWR